MNGTMGIEAGALGCTVLLVVVILTMAGNRQKDVTTGGRRTVSDSPIPRTKNNTSSVEFALHRSAQNKAGDRGPSQGGHDPAKGFMSWLTPGHPGYTGDGGFRVGGNNKNYNGPERHKLQGHELSTAHEFHRMGTINVVIHMIACLIVGPVAGRVNALDTPKRMVSDCFKDYAVSGQKGVSVQDRYARRLGHVIAYIEDTYDLFASTATANERLSRLHILFQLRNVVSKKQTVGDLHKWWLSAYSVGLDMLAKVAAGEAELHFVWKDDQGRYELTDKVLRKTPSRKPQHDFTTPRGVVEYVKTQVAVVINDDDTAEVTEEAVRTTLEDFYRSSDNDSTVWRPKQQDGEEGPVTAATCADRAAPYIMRILEFESELEGC